MLEIGIVIGSTRPNRRGEAVARWVQTLAEGRTDLRATLVDLCDHPLPFLGQGSPTGAADPDADPVARWSRTVAALDGFVFVTPEYNHSTSAVLKNALDHLYDEWNDKAAGFVSYGSTGGVRAVEHLRGIMGELQVATVRQHVALNVFVDWRDQAVFRPLEMQGPLVVALFDQLASWGRAMRGVRAEKGRAAAA